MVLSSSSPRPPSSLTSTKQPPAKLRRQSTFERQSQPPPNLPQPTTPTLLSLSRNSSRSQSTPPQHTLSTSTSFGESIFQSLSFGPLASAPPKLVNPDTQRSPPVRTLPMLADVLESPTGLDPHGDPGSETPQPPSLYSGQKFAPTRRRVTSPDTTYPFDLARADSPNSAEIYTLGAMRLGSLSPLSPPLSFGDAHPRKARPTLRLSRLRPGLGKEEMAQLDGESTPDTTPAPRIWESGARPSSARGSTTGDRQRATPARRPGSAGEIARKSGYHGTREDMGGEWDAVTRTRSSSGVNGKGRGMRMRASSELTRPGVPLSTILREVDESPLSGLNHDRPRYAELRPPLHLSNAGVSMLTPVPVSPGVQSTWSKHTGESALADDSDVDADAPTTPSLTTGASRAGSRSNSSAKDIPGPDPRSQGFSTTPKPFVPILDSDALDRTRAREHADRRRRGDTAREREGRKQHSKYFKLKGPSKERCHAFPVEEVPYPVSYSPKVLDHYNLEADLSLQTAQGVSFHKFEVPPAKVLDLGCGTGYWILKAAHEWTETEFVGFDLVPIQPNLERVMARSGVSIKGASHVDLRLHERIRWVHGNFLERLPFEDGEFDLVRCRKIARGVPESKWDELYEEIVRVMKPGAAFEHIEEDIIFPSEISNKPNPPAVAVYPTPSPSRTLPTPPYLSSTSLPPGAASIRPPDQYRRSPSTSFSSVLESSPVEGRNTVPSISSTSSTSLAGSYEPLTSRLNASPLAGNPRATLGVPGLASAPIQPDTSTSSRDSRGSGDSSERALKPGQATDYSFNDPRVHTRLEQLFVSMHDARWINLKPLSIIPRMIQEHLTGTISAPPLNMWLPPRPRDSPRLSRKIGLFDVARASGEKSGIQMAKLRAASIGTVADESAFLPQPGDEELGRYLTFDFGRMGTVFKHGANKLMPVGQFQFDLGWLPLHLSCAATEVLACKEAMWDHLKEQDPTFDRREYDAMIRQYQTDMQDRIGLSCGLREKLHWGPPESDFMRTPDQRVFEEHYAQAIARDQADPASADRPPSLMRCFRAFIAWKPTEST